MKDLRWTLIALALAVATSANAYPNYQSGHITNVTFAGDDVLIMLDSGLPDNCVGTPYGWMQIPSTAKVTKAFVLGLWLRGDLLSVAMTVYTSGRDSSGYCQINQIDPVE